MNKLTLQALALTGILAVSGLPAFAAEMAPGAPSASTSVDTKAKTSVEKTKPMAAKKTMKTSKKVAKNTKAKVHRQSAQHPAPIPPVRGSAGTNTSIGAGNAGVNGSAGATAQH